MNCRNVTFMLQQRILRHKFPCSVNLKVQFSIKNTNKDEILVPSEVSKDSLQWRESWEQKGEWYSKLKVFANDRNNTDVLRFLQSDIDLRPSTIKKWYLRRKEEREIYMQQYIPERNRILGNNLAASHFMVYRGGKVKFYGSEKWIEQDENMEYNLPNKYEPTFVVQAIDCSKVNLYYEGLENFKGLNKIESLILKGCNNMDDWCLDRISGLLRDSIKYLDIRNCNKITHRGVGALYRTTKLETLLVDNVNKSKELEMTCLMLQELLPKLKIITNE